MKMQIFNITHIKNYVGKYLYFPIRQTLKFNNDSNDNNSTKTTTTKLCQTLPVTNIYIYIFPLQFHYKFV